MAVVSLLTCVQRVSTSAPMYPCEGGYCPLSPDLIPLSSEEGYRLLLDGEHQSFYQLVHQLETQQTTTWCGIASLVTVLNALSTSTTSGRFTKPPTFCYRDHCYRRFTQQYLAEDNACTRAVVHALPLVEGLDLPQLQQMLACLNVSSTLHYHTSTTPAEFISLLSLVHTSTHYLIANFEHDPVYSSGERFGHHNTGIAAGLHDDTLQKIVDADILVQLHPHLGLVGLGPLAPGGLGDVERVRRLQPSVLQALEQ